MTRLNSVKHLLGFNAHRAGRGVLGKETTIGSLQTSATRTDYFLSDNEVGKTVRRLVHGPDNVEDPTMRRGEIIAEVY